MVSKNELASVLENATCLKNEESVRAAIDKLAENITERLSDACPIVLCIMTGGVYVAGQLLPKLKFDMEFDYIHATRYSDKMKGEDITWRATPKLNLSGRTILLVDDILDKGITLAETIKYCQKQGASEVLTAVLVNKNTQRDESGINHADFVALEVEDKYVFGCGLDYRGFHRNVPAIYAVNFD